MGDLVNADRSAEDFAKSVTKDGLHHGFYCEEIGESVWCFQGGTAYWLPGPAIKEHFMAQWLREHPGTWFEGERSLYDTITSVGIRSMRSQPPMRGQGGQILAQHLRCTLLSELAFGLGPCLGSE